MNAFLILNFVFIICIRVISSEGTNPESLDEIGPSITSRHEFQWRVEKPLSFLEELEYFFLGVLLVCFDGLIDICSFSKYVIVRIFCFLISKKS
jgi:hypothetical protein